MFTNVIVRRVHWLRARAQLMRWREEVTLTGYEMHWVVRYFLNKSQTWDHLISGTGTSTVLGDAPLCPTSPPIFLRHLCIFLLILASPRRSALAALIPESNDHVM